jgi:diphthine synthase
MLSFVGLGLYDERSITLEGRDALRSADRAFAELYTSRLTGTTLAELERFHGVDIERCDRGRIERDPEPILAAAESGDAALLVGGDPMVSTTHVDLRLRAHERGIDTRVVHGTTAATAAASLTGLQNYRFGKATTLPFPRAVAGNREVPASVLDSIERNRERGLHTLVYLDIKTPEGRYEPDDAGEQFLTASRAAGLLASAWTDGLAVAVCRAGSPEPLVAADRCSALAARSFGDPLHLLVVPGRLHHLEAESLRELAGAPATAVEELLD